MGYHLVDWLSDKEAVFLCSLLLAGKVCACRNIYSSLSCRVFFSSLPAAGKVWHSVNTIHCVCVARPTDMPKAITETTDGVDQMHPLGHSNATDAGQHNPKRLGLEKTGTLVQRKPLCSVLCSSG